MKITINQWFFRGLCLVLLGLTTSTLHAQWYDHLSKEEKEQKSIELINDAEVFVAGVPIDSRCFYGKDGKTIYTRINIKVKHWYKGTGGRTISVITEGGTIGDDMQYIEHSADPAISFGKEYFLLFRKNDNGDYEYANNSKSSFGRYSDTRYDDFEIIAFYEIKFDSIESFHQFIQKSKSIKIPVKKKDVGYQTSSKSLGIEIDETWLASLGPLHAGVGQVLTIKGQNFGTKGNILFMNGDNPGQRFTGIDNNYVIKWDPTEIQVIIPSKITEGQPDNAINTAGSGTIIVQRKKLFFTEEKESLTQLNIEYSVTNVKTENYPVFGRPYVAREHCLNGFVFTLHESFMGNTPAIEAVEAALSSWAGELGITLEIEKTLTATGEDYYFHNSTLSPKRNLIYFDPTLWTPQNNVYMRTERDYWRDVYEPITPPASPSFWIHNSDIRIRPADGSFDWHYNISGSINYNETRDFYSTILHEIGHALGLGHDVKITATEGFDNKKNLMHPIPIITIGSDPENERVTLSQYSDRAKAGAQRVIGTSRTHNWTTNFSNKYGLETLAASGDNSDVLPTPEIMVEFPEEGNIYKVRLSPTSFDESNNYTYYWQPDGEEANYIERTICTGPRPRSSTHRVRIKDDACTVSSLYSLPKTIGELCFGLGRDEDDSAPIAQPLINIYPNPTKGQFNIQFNPIEGEEIPYIGDTYIGVYDNLGNLQKQYNIGDTLRQTTIDISALPAGTYWVVWFVDGEVIETKQVYKN